MEAALYPGGSTDRGQSNGAPNGAPDGGTGRRTTRSMSFSPPLTRSSSPASAAAAAEPASTEQRRLVSKRSLTLPSMDMAVLPLRGRRSRARATPADPQLMSLTTQLPWEIMVQIFFFLELRDLLRARLVCRRWKALSDDNVLWQQVRRRRGRR